MTLRDTLPLMRKSNAASPSGLSVTIQYVEESAIAEKFAEWPAPMNSTVTVSPATAWPYT